MKPASDGSPGDARWRGGVFSGPLAGLAAWAGCVAAMAWHMRPEWTLNETYRYGWLVPLMAGYLFSLRWRDRPPATPDGQSSQHFWAAALVLLPVLWILHGAAPDWRLCGLGLAAVAVGVGLLWLRDAGGWGWVRHFGGAVGFLVVAAPWPSGLEAAVTRPLIAANAGMALEVLHWLGVPAIRSGGLITLRESTLGVEEACSGIRSLQATLMLGVFLGELHRLRIRSRLGLLVMGVLVALFTNVVRTLFLSVMTSWAGAAAADRWHDTAGLIGLAVQGAALMIIASRFPAGPAPQSNDAGERGCPAWPVAGPCLVLAALFSMGPLSSWWFGRRVPELRPPWTLVAPETASGFEPVAIPQRTREILRFHDGWSARWQTSEGQLIHAFFLEWRAGQVPPEILHSHQPGHCLTLAGMVQVADHGWPMTIPVDDVTRVPVRCQEFADRGRSLFVFHGVDEQVSGVTGPETRGFGPRDRLRSAWQGRRSEGLRLVEIGIWNARDLNDAKSLASSFFQHQLRVGLPGGASGTSASGD